MRLKQACEINREGKNSVDTLLKLELTLKTFMGLPLL
jgi:hypothetical protein